MTAETFVLVSHPAGAAEADGGQTGLGSDLTTFHQRFTHIPPRTFREPRLAMKRFCWRSVRLMKSLMLEEMVLDFPEKYGFS